MTLFAPVTVACSSRSYRPEINAVSCGEASQRRSSDWRFLSRRQNPSGEAATVDEHDEKMG